MQTCTLDSCIIVKKGPNTGEASVRLEIGEGMLNINKIMIDLNDGASPITILKSEGTPVVSGSFIDYLKEIILDVFQNALSDEDHGLFEISNGDTIKKH